MKVFLYCSIIQVTASGSSSIGVFCSETHMLQPLVRLPSASSAQRPTCYSLWFVFHRRLLLRDPHVTASGSSSIGVFCSETHMLQPLVRLPSASSAQRPTCYSLWVVFHRRLLLRDPHVTASGSSSIGVFCSETHMLQPLVRLPSASSAQRPTCYSLWFVFHRRLLLRDPHVTASGSSSIGVFCSETHMLQPLVRLPSASSAQRPTCYSLWFVFHRRLLLRDPHVTASGSSSIGVFCSETHMLQPLGRLPSASSAQRPTCYSLWFVFHRRLLLRDPHVTASGSSSIGVFCSETHMLQPLGRLPSASSAQRPTCYSLWVVFHRRLLLRDPHVTASGSSSIGVFCSETHMLQPLGRLPSASSAQRPTCYSLWFVFHRRLLLRDQHVTASGSSSIGVFCSETHMLQPLVRLPSASSAQRPTCYSLWVVFHRRLLLRDPHVTACGSSSIGVFCSETNMLQPLGRLPSASSAQRPTCNSLWVVFHRRLLLRDPHVTACGSSSIGVFCSETHMLQPLGRLPSASSAQRPTCYSLWVVFHRRLLLRDPHVTASGSSSIGVFCSETLISSLVRDAPRLVKDVQLLVNERHGEDVYGIYSALNLLQGFEPSTLAVSQWGGVSSQRGSTPSANQREDQLGEGWRASGTLPSLKSHWRVTGESLKSHWRVSEESLESHWRVTGESLKSHWRVSEESLESH
ncbi:hypothetical protein NQZ68_040265 [Dissostichus eleginoides]|nr:hypothetical protein NQZ68_040265 [Dissostichus eleginoides]